MNRGADSVLSVYSDARAEYTKQLCLFLVPAYFQFFIELLDRAKQDRVNEPKRILWQFQTYLNEIHDWNMEKVSHEIQRIQTNCGCDYLEDLLTAVFIAHTKVLTAIRLSSQHKKVEIHIPKVEHFLFKVLCETSKLLWGSTYLFREGVPSIEKQQNYRAIEGLLNEGVLQAVRTMVPVKSILKDFVNQGTSDVAEPTEEESDDESEKPSSLVSTANSTLASVNALASATASTLASMNAIASEPAPVPVPVAAAIPVPVPVASPVPVAAADLSVPVPAPAPDLSPVDMLDPLEAPAHQVAEPHVIHLEDKPSVRFGQFDAVFDSDHPSDSEMLYDPKESETEDSIPDLEILDDVGLPLSEGLDFDTL